MPHLSLHLHDAIGGLPFLKAKRYYYVDLLSIGDFLGLICEFYLVASLDAA